MFSALDGKNEAQVATIFAGTRSNPPGYDLVFSSLCIFKHSKNFGKMVLCVSYHNKALGRASKLPGMVAKHLDLYNRTGFYWLINRAQG